MAAFSLMGVALAAAPRVLTSPLEAAPARASRKPYTAALIVPTGVGAAIGGFAGDALPVARAFTAVADRLVTHPNVMNGAMLYAQNPALLYTEGFALDEFAAGNWGLRPATSQRVGLLLDAAIEPELRLRHLQAADAVRATLGVCVGAYTITDEPVGVDFELTPSGASWGTVSRPHTLLRGAQKLIDAGCTAIAVVARFPDEEDEEALANYRAGCGVDEIGGAEAVISHLLTRELRVPCAHAPATAPMAMEENLSPRACAEEIGHTFLPCVLANLAGAPSLITREAEREEGDIWVDELDAIVVPVNACGGPAVLSLLNAGKTLVVSVEENVCSGAHVRAQALQSDGGAVAVRSYMEALGLLAAHKAGIHLPCLTAHIDPIRDMYVS